MTIFVKAWVSPGDGGSQAFVEKRVPKSVIFKKVGFLALPVNRGKSGFCWVGMKSAYIIRCWG